MSANSELIFYWVHLLKNSIVGLKRKKVPPASKKKTPYVPSSAKFGDKETREEAWGEQVDWQTPSSNWSDSSRRW